MGAVACEVGGVGRRGVVFGYENIIKLVVEGGSHK